MKLIMFVFFFFFFFFFCVLHWLLSCLCRCLLSKCQLWKEEGGSSKGREPVIDIDNLSPRPKRAWSLIGVYDLEKFRSYAAFQNYERYFEDAPLLVERAVDQKSLLETKIPEWFATKDWNFLLYNLDDAYEDMVKEFYANAISEGKELKCWVRGKCFSMTLVYLAEILRIN